nr:hypothetical protein [Tanacetum cinerariifolium]
MLHVVQESTLQDAEKYVSFATVVVTENTHKKVNFRKVEEDIASNVDYKPTIPMSCVVKHPRLLQMLYSYMSTMCNESLGRSSYAYAMIKVHANVELTESIVVVVPKLEGNSVKEMPIKKVEGEMDGFQLVKNCNAGRNCWDYLFYETK